MRWHSCTRWHKFKLGCPFGDEEGHEADADPPDGVVVVDPPPPPALVAEAEGVVEVGADKGVPVAVMQAAAAALAPVMAPSLATSIVFEGADAFGKYGKVVSSVGAPLVDAISVSPPPAVFSEGWYKAANTAKGQPTVAQVEMVTASVVSALVEGAYKAGIHTIVGQLPAVTAAQVQAVKTATAAVSKNLIASAMEMQVLQNSQTSASFSPAVVQSLAGNVAGVGTISLEAAKAQRMALLGKPVPVKAPAVQAGKVTGYKPGAYYGTKTWYSYGKMIAKQFPWSIGKMPVKYTGAVWTGGQSIGAASTPQ